jgi:steroid delta-isomerase-like uncharacterized protein
MSKEQNMAALQLQGEAVHSGQLEKLRDVFAPNVVDHDPAPDQAKGPDGFIQFFKGLRTAFPDVAVSVDYVVADDDNVAMAYTITGTHNGPLGGIPATGKKIKARGMQIARFQNGKIVERWGSSDELGILKQIGAVKG